MQYKVKTQEIWINFYNVEAESEEEARDKVLNGDLCVDYFPTDDSKKALPKAFIDFYDVGVINDINEKKTKAN